MSPSRQPHRLATILDTLWNATLALGMLAVLIGPALRP